MTKRELQTISPAETEILRLVWQLRAATVQQVCDSLPQERDVAYATVQTLLRRLEKKRYLKHLTEGKAHVFYPAAKQEAVITKSVNDFLGRLFGGDPIPLLHYLAEHGKMTSEDIEALKRLIEKE